jgi:hypothetical protein
LSGLPVEGIGLDMIQALEPGPRIMRYELTDFERSGRSFRGILRVDDRRVLNGIFWVLRSGAPWRDLPETHVRKNADFLSRINVICPVQSPSQKHSASCLTQNHFTHSRHPTPQRGVAHVTNAGRDAVDADGAV